MAQCVECGKECGIRTGYPVLCDACDTLDLSPEGQEAWERESAAYVSGLGDLTAKPAVPFGWDKV